MRRVLQLAALALVGYTWYFIRTWMPRLPGRVPVHFDFAGRPNRYGSPDTLWFLVVAQLVMTVVFLGLPALTARYPQMGHIGARRFSDLDPAARQQTIDLLADMMVRMALGLELLFLYIARETVRVAVQPSAGFAAWPIFVFVGFSILVAITYTMKMKRIAK